ncbi:acyltransferase family protein [Enterobacter cloacae]|uniref:acyltransferase family protein n=1 Tax=Enterobacter cloacae TaxID=550 RepID=UPI002549E186|nr:acyltransferase [Enterobacter cloacae]
MTDTPPNRLDSLHTMRGLAAITVMFFHFSWILDSAYGGLGNNLMKYGYLGVDIFFIISGFVISMSSSKASSNLNGCFSFMKHRLMRLFPAYYFWLLVAFLTGGAMSTFHYPDKVDNLISAFTMTPVTSQNGPLYLNNESMYGVRWSLIYEMYFYLLVTFSLFVKNRAFALSLIITAMVLVVPVVAGLSPTLNDVGIESGNKFLNMATNPIILLFLYGVIFQKGYRHAMQLPAILRRTLGLCLLITSIVCIQFAQNVTHSPISGGLYMLFIFIAATINEDLFKNKTPKLILFFGDISYSLYLIHTLMNSGLDKRFTEIGLPNGWFKFALYCLISILLACASYTFIEKPFFKKNTKRAVLE